MTQIASGPRGHQVDLYEHAQPRKMQLVDPVSLAYAGEVVSLLPSLAEPATPPTSAAPAATPPTSAAPAATAPAAGPTALGGQPEPAEDLLSAVWRTSSYVESVEWELDSAQGQLLQAVRQAATAGLPHEELRKAANMTAPELAAALATDSLALVPYSGTSS